MTEHNRTHTIIYPSIFNQVDPSFKKEMIFAQSKGFLIAFLSEEESKLSKIKYLPHNPSVIYRGWMLSEDEYWALSLQVEAQGSHLVNGLNQYMFSHHIPNWYKVLKDFTIETKQFEDKTGAMALFETDKTFTENGVFLKDFVKSLKTSRGSVAQSAEEVSEIVDEMIRVRGSLEGGLIVRKHVKIVHEVRFFFFKGMLLCPDDVPFTDEMKSFARRVVSKLKTYTNFCSIDIGTTYQGETLLVEIGDGQVSDLLGFSNEYIWENLHG